MEANFLRYLFQEVAYKLQGSHIQKVYVPVQGVCTFQLQGRKNLILSFVAKQEALFLSASKPDNPFQPPALAQWLRKSLKNKKIVELLSDWPRRRLALKLDPDRDKWLVLDLRQGPFLLSELPEDFAVHPCWPKLEELDQDPKNEIWRSFPQLTPPLRYTLSSLPGSEGQKLLDSLQKGCLAKFYLYKYSNAESLLPWKLPDSLQAQSTCQVFDSASEAAEIYGWNKLRAVLSRKNEAEKEQRRIEKKLRRNLNRLEEDAKRLQSMVDKKFVAMLLQANLYQIDYNQKTKELDVKDFEGRLQSLTLDPKLTVLENMQKMFRRAAKGARGLQHIDIRKKELAEQLANVQKEKTPDTQTEPSLVSVKDKENKKNQESARFKGIAVHVYKSSDGFIILRGKNKKANHLLLSQASRAHDLWFHAQDSSGAHVVLRLDHERQQVPEQSKLEAAALAGLASQQSGADRARVLCARVKHVRKVKGAALGQVRVDQVQESLNVKLDQEIENRLLISG